MLFCNSIVLQKYEIENGIVRNEFALFKYKITLILGTPNTILLEHFTAASSGSERFL